MSRAPVIITVVAVAVAVAGGLAAWRIRHDEALKTSTTTALAALEAEEQLLRARDTTAQSELGRLTREELELKASIRVLEAVVADLKTTAAAAAAGAVDAASADAASDASADVGTVDAGAVAP